MRIYELAKELGVENKIIISKAQELGMEGKKSHSNSLTDDEAKALRRVFIREAVGEVAPRESEVVKTQVDSLTGEEKTIVERRKGNVVRRRKARKTTEPVVEQEQSEKISEEASSVSAVEEQIPSEVATSVENDSEVATSVENDVPEESQQELVEEVVAIEEPAVVTEEVVAEASSEELKSKVGPKVLGKITLAQPKPKVVKKKAVSEQSRQVSYGEDKEGRSSAHKGKKKKSRRREFDRGDLVDYSGRQVRRKPRNQKNKNNENQEVVEAAPTKASKMVIKMPGDVITVGELAHQMSLKAGEIIKKLIELGVMATINQAIDTDTATILADEFGFTLEQTGFDEEELLKIEDVDDPDKLASRPPVVTVMGHVDHGKTSLLDHIRKASVAAKEHGGITQHIGAYSVSVGSDKSVTFIDTPGHAAFTEMRARGAQITDIVILVVAADDGVMPQTVEAINHAKAAGVTIVVAMNKMDKAEANPDKLRQQLAERGLQPEDWGGDVMFFPVSALTGDGINELLEGVALVAEMQELKANPECRVQGAIIEARQELGRGTVATVLVKAGTLNIGDIFISGSEYGRIRSMLDHNGKKIKSAGPSTPVEITGLNGVPTAGDDFIVVENESNAKQISEKRKERDLAKNSLSLAGGPVSLEEFAKMATQGEVAELCLIIKADVQGSLEAVKSAVEDLSTDKVKVRVVHGAVGGVNESDIQLGIASKALVVGFGVRGENRALQEADNKGIEVRFYRVIYELIDDVKSAMAGLLAPIEKEVSLGAAEVRETFSVPKAGTVAGCYVINGKIKRGVKVRLLRDSRVIYEGNLGTLRRFKDDVKEVAEGYECGLSIEGYNDIKQGDVVEVYEIEEIAATL